MSDGLQMRVYGSVCSVLAVMYDAYMKIKEPPSYIGSDFHLIESMTNPEVRRLISKSSSSQLIRLLIIESRPETYQVCAMHRCTCSVQALEVFVKDFAGISVRQPQFRIASYQRHNFSTRFPRRQLATSTAHIERINDDFVFEATESTPLREQTVPQVKHASNEMSKRSPQELDEAWGSDADAVTHADVDSLTASRQIKKRHEEFAAVEDVALQAEGPAMQMMARKMKRLEKKRKRQAEGTWAPLKKERQERGRSKVRERGSVKGAEKVEGLEGAKTVVGKAQGKVARTSGGKQNSKMGDMTPRSKKEKTRGTSKAGDRDTKFAEAKQHEQHPERPAKIPKTRRETMRVDSKVAEDGPKSAKSTQRAKLATKTFGGKTFTGSLAKASKDPKDSRATSRQKANEREVWQVQKASLERKFGEKGWQPSKRLSPDTIEGIRALHASDPKNYETETLAKHFQITPEAIRRILKSKWRPNEEEAEDRRQRWERRGVKKWTEMAELGMTPPAKWRALGVTSKEQQEKREKGRRKGKRDDLLWDEREDVAASESFAERIP